jgi:Domain of unknown function (DUF3291)/SnoaL-like domain
MVRVAFMTIGLLHETYEHPRTQSFSDRSGSNFLAAEASEGFIGYTSYPGPNDEQLWGMCVFPTNFQSEDYANRVATTLSLWQDLESVFAFAYNGVHAEALSKRKEWFLLPRWPSYVAWWVNDDHIPSWKEASTQYDKLHQEGSAPQAFDFKHPFGTDGRPMQIDREAAKRKAAQHKTGKPMTIESTLEKYVAAWSEPDAAARQSLLEAVWSADGTYTDPMSHAANRAELDAIIARFLSANPGAKFTLKDKIDSHHGHVRFFWTLHFANGTELPGMDYGELAPDGKLIKIVGFF